MLSLENEGRQVKLLQSALGAIKVDGVFGPETEEAVRRFQTGRGLAADGVVGPATTSALGSHAARMRFASLHSELPGEGAHAEAPGEALASSGASAEAASAASAGEGEADASSAAAEAASQSAVRRLQAALHLPVDGELGPATAAAVQRLQARHGLAVDGVVGPATWGVIGVHHEGTLTPPASALPEPAGQTGAAAAEGEGQAAPGSAGGSPTSSIRRLQAALHLPVDGELGPATAAAIQRLQARHGVTVDGVVGPATWGIIGVSAERTLDPPRSAFAQREARSSEGSSRSSEGSSRSSEDSGGSGEERHSSEGEQSRSSGSTSSSGGSEGSGAVGRVIAAGNEIASRPYVYGGGHGSFSSRGYDCSGSVSYALHGAGLISSPQDSTSLESYGSSGPGKHITIYANSEHTFMVVDGKRFDTGAQREGGSRWSSSMTSTSGYVVRHPSGY
jgi:peptidoglycan hydrolase-like protein with peptidoglycan-binding domain